MKKPLKLISCGIVLSFLLVLSFPVQAQPQRPQYMVFRGGLYSPQTSALNDFKTGFNGEAAFGYQFDRNWALEAGAGYFETSAKNKTGFGYSSLPATVHLRVVPLTVAIKGSIPINRVDLYGIGGIGAYFLETDLDYPDDYYDRRRDRESETLFGGFLGMGARFNVTPKVFFGLEGKYLWTTRSTYINAETDLSGIVGAFTLGFRF
jgi:opacity protein-like surface antigen